MNTIDKILIGTNIIKSNLLKIRVPLVVGWALTHRCNLNCLYCGFKYSEAKELETKEILSIIDQLKKAGTKILSFTGGEPLIRDDIDSIVEYAVNKKMLVNINTNGMLFTEKSKQLKNISSVRFSLDGTREINDSIRGQGVFEKVVGAIKLAQEIGIKASICTVLASHNLNCISPLLDIAEQLKVKIMFQPVTLSLLGTEHPNPFIPESSDYKATLEYLIKRKKEGNKYIFNSLQGLDYLKQWPQGRKIFCSSRYISCRIEPDGYVYHCGRKKGVQPALRFLPDGVNRAFRNLRPVSCNDCWCAPALELNFIASLNIRVILTHL